MYQLDLITNNTKRTNSASSSSRTTDSYTEPEFSYNDVLRDEVSRFNKQRKRHTSNNSRYNNNSNIKNNFNTSPQLSLFPDYNNNFSVATSTNNANKSTYDDLMDYVKQLIDKKKVVKGDANGDGVVDLKDLKAMVDRMFDNSVDINMKNVDFDGDGKISINDISEVIKLIVEPNTEPEPPEKQILKGDVNGDGKVTQADAYTLERYYLGYDVDINMDNADMNDDGKVSILDVNKLKNLVKELNPNMGDVDGDGKITQKDVQTLEQYILGYDVKINMDNSDMNGNGKITMADVSEVQALADVYDPRVLKGDVNNDGKVNYKDVKALELNTVGLGGNIDRKAADIDDDGNITITDTLKVRKLANEYESKFQSIRGDSNGDGIVDERDFTNIKNFINNVNSSDDFVMKNSDINGDGEINEEDLNRLRDIVDGFNVNYSSTTNLGDIDGDGSISIKDAMFLKNYINRIGNAAKDFFINNADVNKDGKLDISDITAITDLLKNVKTVERQVAVFDNSDLTQPSNYTINKSADVIVLEQKGDSYKVQYSTQNGDKIGWVHKSIFEPEKIIPPIQYPYDGQYNSNAIWTYTDENLTNHQGNDVITSGQIVKVLGETDKVWHISYINVNNEVVERYIPKQMPANYQSWYATALTYKEAYSDDGSRIGAVFANDPITILDENDTSYKVEYPISNGNTKIGWITKTDVIPHEKPDTPPLQDMHVSDKGIAMIKEFEGFRPKEYQNPGEKYRTIGYGHYGADVKEGMEITLEQAEEYLRQDLIKAENLVKTYCSHFNLNQNQFDALVSFTFNCGEGNLNKLLHGESGNENRPLEELPEHMPYYRKGSGKILPGLVNRRNAEVDLFNTPV